jgi:serine/threonine protein phosphatase PrpC
MEKKSRIEPPKRVSRKSGKSKTISLGSKKLHFDGPLYGLKLHQNKEFNEYMEDFTLIIEKFMKDDKKQIYCIFDGHGGDSTARICVNSFKEIFEKLCKENPNDIEGNFHKCFKELDEEIKKKGGCPNVGNTATVIYIDKNMIYIANVGDSSAVLVYNDKAAQVTIDDKATNPEEMKRIEKEGGKVFDERLEGILAISRGIGDLDLKEKGLTNEPHIFKAPIDEHLQFVVVASDGVWDVMTPHDIYEICTYDKNPASIVDKIVEESISYGSEDNISCIVASLKHKDK